MKNIINLLRSLKRRVGSQSTIHIVTAALFLLTVVSLFSNGFSIRQATKLFNYDVLVLLIVMELFTNLICETGIMEYLTMKLARFSRGRKQLCVVLFGLLMFFISSMLNNITAVMMILPIVFLLFNALDVDRKYIAVFFANLLALSNTGGAASPIGDFPAIIILTSGITSFMGYLTRAYPLFLITSIVIISVWGLQIRDKKEDKEKRLLAVICFQSQFKHRSVRWNAFWSLVCIFIGMFIVWSCIPANVFPPEIVATLGYVIASAICSILNIKIRQRIDMTSLLLISAFLFLSAAISETGILTVFVGFLIHNVHNQYILLLAVMIITSIIAGIFSAGPAASAFMPVITELINTSFQAQADWIAVAFAASICAGSSLFLSSATAGFVVSARVSNADLKDVNNKQIKWTFRDYLKYGMVNYLIQMIVALLWMSFIIKL